MAKKSCLAPLIPEVRQSGSSLEAEHGSASFVADDDPVQYIIYGPPGC
ncbi:MAG: hypothetical protein HY274_02355 [Gammaproteobacteria bacterium]|nr:hypothetical protein [Gammaproteobacteria bacterium]